MIVTDIIAAFVGFSAGLLIGKLYSVKKHTDAYESGWSHGYDVGNKHSHDPHGTASVDDGEEVE